MRGDHFSYKLPRLGRKGTSPHARGPRSGKHGGLLVFGNIPACAGTTRYVSETVINIREHPRMRGDHGKSIGRTMFITGTSPHARGPLIDFLHRESVGGNIPACAGTTCPRTASRAAAREHPRMRGDHFASAIASLLASGTSPHARGPQIPLSECTEEERNIPACAGTTRAILALKM